LDEGPPARLVRGRHVVKEEIAGGVVGDDNVRPTVAIDVTDEHAQCLAGRPQPALLADPLLLPDLDAGLLGDVLEVFARVAVEEALRPLERPRRAVGTRLAVEGETLTEVPRRRPGYVVADEQVELAIAIVVKKGRRGRKGDRLLVFQEVPRSPGPA